MGVLVESVASSPAWKRPMIRTRRTVQIVSGRHDDAMARSRELEAIWTDHGIVHVTTTEVTGDCERLLWTKHWDSKDAYETGQRILQSDPRLVAIQDRNWTEHRQGTSPFAFPPHDEFWSDA